MATTSAPLTRLPASRPADRTPANRHARGDALRALLVAGGVATLVLWWFDTPMGIAPGLGGAFTAFGQMTGLLGGYLLLAEVTLMARTPWLEQRIGTDRVAGWHRSLGEYTVVMLAAHAVLLILGASLTLHEGLPKATVTMVFDYPDVLSATVGTALLVGVGILSARAIRPRLKYETWHATHVLAYLGLLLGFSHQISIGSSFTTPLVRAGWVGLHVAVAFAAGWWRVLAPLRLYLKHQFRVAAVISEGPRTVSILITGQRLDELKAQPGQFFRWRFLTPDRWWQAHPFSLSAAPDGDSLRITVKALGDHTAQLSRLRPGTPVLAEGPYGAITPALLGARRLLLIAGGVGITPLRALLDAVAPAAPGQRPEAALIQRVNSHDELLFSAELAALAKSRRVELHPLVGPPNRVRLDGPRLRSLIPDVADREVIVCGPPGMVEATVAGLREAGVPPHQVHVEQFAL
jgi:predicted ferric reductase